MTTPRPARPPGRGRRVDDRGSASVQMVVWLPVVFAVMFLGLQAALYYHARTVAIAAAEEGAHAAAETGTTGDGLNAASMFVEAAGGDDVLAGPTITVARTPA